MKTKVVVVAALVSSMLFAPANGEHRTVRDGNDTKGRADIRSLRMKNDRPRKWIFRTWKAWRVNDFFEKGYFVLYLDTVGDERFDYFVFLRAKRKRLGAAIWRDRANRDDRKIANVKVRKTGPKLVRVYVPFRKIKIGKNRLKYRWFGRSLWSSGVCRRLCLDRAPDHGAVSELLVPNP